MGTRTMAIAAVALALSALVEAQVPATVRKVEPKRTPEPFAPGDCAIPALPSTVVIPWIPNTGDKFEWCVDSATTAQATASAFKVYVDGATAPLAVDHACISVAAGQSVPCFSMVPDQVVAALRTTGQHTIEMTRSVGGVESPKAPALRLETPGCQIVDLTQTPPILVTAKAPIFGNPPAPSEDPPAGQENAGLAAIQREGLIARRTLYNAHDAALAVALLRLAGWRVEWWRTQYEAPNPPTSSAGGHWYFLATCTGIPGQ